MELHRVSVTVTDPNHPAVSQRKSKIEKRVRVKARDRDHAVDSALNHYKKAGYKVHDHNYIGKVNEEVDLLQHLNQLQELSNEKLGQYKQKASAQATAADKAGDFKKGDKRFSGIVKATKKQFANDMKKHVKEEVELDEMTQGKEYTHDQLKKKIQSGQWEATHDIKPGKHVEMRHHTGKKVTVYVKEDLDGQRMKEEVELEEGSNYNVTVTHVKADKSSSKHDYVIKNANDERHAKNIALNRHTDKHGLKQGEQVHTDSQNVKSMKEEAKQISEGAYEKSEENKRSADAAKKQGDMFAHHLHMADHHENLSQWHSSKGRHGEADKHAEKAEQHHDLAMKHKTKKEEVAANNVGDGKIAGTQGDAGKKAVMTKPPLRRKKLTEFKEFLEINEDAVDAKGHKSASGGLTQKGRDYYNRKTGGNLQAPVTTKPSKLDPDSKAAKRRKSFCARMSGMKKRLTSAKTANDPDSRINKALRKWNC